MRFDLTDDQKALRDTLDSFFKVRFGGAQGVTAIDTPGFDRILWGDIVALGLGDVLVPEAAGGLDMGLLTLVVAAEVAGHYAVPAPVMTNALAAWLIAQSGDADLRDRWLAPVREGRVIAAFALAEAGGWQPSNWTFGPVATGAKHYVENADVADLFLVGCAGGSIGLATADQVIATSIDTLDRTRPLFDLAFDATQLRAVSDDPALAVRLVDALLLLHAADALGAATAAHARAVAYAGERRQFGQVIGSFQALKHQLADISVELEPARPLCWYAAHAWDTGRDDAHRLAALAKAHLGDIAVASTRAAVEAHGGIGYTWEHPVHLFLKRAMHDRTIFGTPNFHRERAAALAGW
ncbi:MAG: acyl-CoA dehydrogenase [Bradyrhizobium sp.]|nr:acyl-CoA dehydrogenase [Bradyrhizobium sp.]